MARLLSGEPPTSSRILLRWLRRLVFGEAEAGGRAGRLNTTAGVSGPPILGFERNGDDMRPALLVGFMKGRVLVGESYDEPRMRAISSSARPRLIGRSGSASEVSRGPSGWPLVADDSMDE
jgi:hypothetical protein